MRTKIIYQNDKMLTLLFWTFKKLLNMPVNYLEDVSYACVCFFCVIRPIIPFIYSPSLYHCINYSIDSIYHLMAKKHKSHFPLNCVFELIKSKAEAAVFEK